MDFPNPRADGFWFYPYTNSSAFERDFFCNQKFFSKNLLTNPKIGRIMCNNKFTKEDTDMFASKFYYFYFFNMGCPSFVKTEK